MPNTFLDVPFKQKDEAKALGARWDAAARKWYVPDGMDPGPFSAWLPAGSKSPAATVKAAGRELALPDISEAGDLAVPRSAMSLSQLLVGVAQAVAQAFRAGVWTVVEVVEARSKNGHVYLELSERNTEGSVLATARASIWANTASKILPAFEQATGASIAPGIKLLVRAKPVFKAQYGFSIEIDAIDPEYTLGDLEARKREIRTRLKQEGIINANQGLPAPWDYNAVLVIAPQGAAGLGDFQAEARRLERLGICRFVYATSRFQGEGASQEIRSVLRQALASWVGALPDAVVIIRGGGAVNDLAWLNDYDLAKAICQLQLPVLTGIGHERDSTILDEVAHTRFDTPSKVIAGIEQTIQKRVGEARRNFEQLAALAMRTLHQARHASRQLIGDIRHEAYQALGEAQRQAPSLMSEIRTGSASLLNLARTMSRARMDAIRDRAQLDLRQRREALDLRLRDVGRDARRSLIDARANSTALFREVAGQGPGKTLGRGFAIVRDADGKPVTSSAAIKPDARLDIEFRDGHVATQVR